MKKVLMTASVPSMIGQFNMDNIKILQDLGYQVHIACDFTDKSVWTEQRIEQFKDQMKKMSVVCHQVEFSRSPLKVKKNLASYHQLNTLVKQENFSFIHCHTPVAGVISRMAAHQCRVKVIYTAHGFHFYKGAPIKNWIVFYPIEKFFSRWTDVLVTITKEDYQIASDKFHARKTVYVPGVGVDCSKFCNVSVNRDSIRKTLGVSENEVMLLSVGELNENKNHSTVIRAISRLKEQNIKYYIVGKGILEEQLKAAVKKYQLDNRVVLLGYRTDIPELMKAADIYVLPSIREGLNVSLMEAMASGLPCICGRIRGNVDLIEQGKGGYLFEVHNDDELNSVLKRIISQNGKEMGKVNRFKVKLFSKDEVIKKMRKIYMDI